MSNFKNKAFLWMVFLPGLASAAETIRLSNSQSKMVEGTTLSSGDCEASEAAGIKIAAQEVADKCSQKGGTILDACFVRTKKCRTYERELTTFGYEKTWAPITYHAYCRVPQKGFFDSTKSFPENCEKISSVAEVKKSSPVAANVTLSQPTGPSALWQNVDILNRYAGDDNRSYEKRLADFTLKLEACLNSADKNMPEVERPKIETYSDQRADEPSYYAGVAPNDKGVPMISVLHWAVDQEPRFEEIEFTDSENESPQKVRNHISNGWWGDASDLSGVRYQSYVACVHDMRGNANASVYGPKSLNEIRQEIRIRADKIRSMGTAVAPSAAAPNSH